MIREINLNNGVDYYKFVGWAEDTKDFYRILDEQTTSSEVIKFILDNVVEQAENQAKHIYKEFYMGQSYIDFYQQHLEQIATASLPYCSKYIRKKEQDMFIFGKHLNGVYVFKMEL